MGWNRATIDKPDRARIMGLRVVMRSLAQQTAGTWGRSLGFLDISPSQHSHMCACPSRRRQSLQTWLAPVGIWTMRANTVVCAAECLTRVTVKGPELDHRQQHRVRSRPSADGPGGINHKWAGWDRLGGKLSGGLSIWETSSKLMMIWMGPVRPSVSTRLEEVCDAQYGDGDSLLFLGQLNEFAGWTWTSAKNQKRKKDRSGVPLIANAGCQGSSPTPPGFSFLFCEFAFASAHRCPSVASRIPCVSSSRISSSRHV